jgi:anaerobic selenocysteine-containing dehydrogenase
MKKKDISRRSFLKKSTLAVTGSALLPSLLASKQVYAKDATKNKMFCYQCEQTMGGRGNG